MKGKNVGDGQATVANVTISGQSHSALSAFDVVITLNGATFKAIAANTDVTSWFDNLPAGLIAKVKIAIPSRGATAITITVSETPTVGSARALAITIPGDRNNSGSPITVDSNADAKYAIIAIIIQESDLRNFAEAVNAGDLKQNAKLASSETVIDAAGADYFPIAKDYAHRYKGDFDGSGGVINVNITGATSYLAMFGVNSGTIHDLTITGWVKLVEGPGSTDADFIAVFAAYNDIFGQIIRCVNKAALTAYTEGQPNIAHSIAGFAGFNGCDIFSPDSPYFKQTYKPGGYIFQCRNEGAIIGGFNKIGGLAGENAGTIEQCVNIGDITDVKGKADKGWPGVAGGSGRNGNNNDAIECGVMKHCYSRGQIIANVKQGTGENAYGGITGWSDKLSKVESCYTTGAFVEASGTLRGTKNPIIGMSDEEPAGMGDNNFSLDTIFASSKDDEVLTGKRKDSDYMKTQDFVDELNKDGDGPYVLAVDADGQPDYPILKWEQETGKKN
jgi:hypothetical protein